MPTGLHDWKQVDPSSGTAPVTTASAATVTPTSFLTVLTGNTAVATITPPFPNPHMVALQFAGVAGTVATGNITVAVASVAGQAILFIYNPATAKYTPVQ